MRDFITWGVLVPLAFVLVCTTVAPTFTASTVVLLLFTLAIFVLEFKDGVEIP